MGEETVNIPLELSVNEINVILRSLGKHPFEEIAALIAKIKDQGESRLKELQAAAQAADQAAATPQVEVPQVEEVSAETPAVEG